jgi:hypothetical protein
MDSVSHARNSTAVTACLQLHTLLMWYNSHHYVENSNVTGHAFINFTTIDTLPDSFSHCFAEFPYYLKVF